MTTKKKAAEADATHAADADAGEGSTPSSAEYTVAFTPRQAAVGFAILAGLVALVIRRRHRRKSAAD